MRKGGIGIFRDAKGGNRDFGVIILRTYFLGMLIMYVMADLRCSLLTLHTLYCIMLFIF